MAVSSLLLAAGLAWSGATEIAAGRGERGPWRQNESRYDYVDDPSVALDAAGRACVAWADQARKDVLLRCFDPSGAPLAAAVNVSRSPGSFSWLPRVAFGPGRTLFVLWQEILFTGGSHGGDMLFARSDDGGATFGEPINLSGGSPGGDGKGRVTRESWHNGSFDLAVTGDRVLVAWTEYDGPLWFASSDDGGRSFSKPRHLFGDGRRPARGPSLAVGGGGRVHLAWTVGEDPAADIHLARSQDGGIRWSRALVVERTPAYSDSPKLAADSAGRLHLAWGDGRDIRYARAADGERFEPSRVVGRGGFPALALDGRGGVHLAWERYPAPGQRPRGLEYTVSRDAGGSFEPPATIPGSIGRDDAPNGSFQGLLMRKLAVNAEGAVAAVNSSLRDGHASRVWLLRLPPRP